MKGSTGYSDTSLMDVGMLCFLLLMVSSLDTRFSVLAISLGHIDSVSVERVVAGERGKALCLWRVVIGEVDGRLYVSGESCDRRGGWEALRQWREWDRGGGWEALHQWREL